MYENIIHEIKNLFGKKIIPLHEPTFGGNEKAYLNECIDSTFVSSVGEFVDRFERQIADFTGAKFAVAVVNGTAALHAALIVAGVEKDTEVITQPFTFVATCNAVSYCGAEPVFVDVDVETLGMSPHSLEKFLSENTEMENDVCINKTTNRKISACVPMHTFGHPCKIDEIANICDKYNISVVEDAAESLGSYYKEKHTGTFGRMGILSFNGNKIITSGGGGAIITNDSELARRAKHITTTAKIPHSYEYFHDETGYNYRMPNINAALACAQLEKIDLLLEKKRATAEEYKKIFVQEGIRFFTEPLDCRSNYWLNTVILDNREQRDIFLEETNEAGVMTRPLWEPMHKLSMFSHCYQKNLLNCDLLDGRIVNIPSSVY